VTDHVGEQFAGIVRCAWEKMYWCMPSRSGDGLLAHQELI
jgi:hypothetical protein